METERAERRRGGSLRLLALLVILALASVACGGDDDAGSMASDADASDADVVADDVAAAGGDDQEMFLIGMSQANKGEPWRQAMNDQIEAAAAEHPEIEVVFADAAQDNAKQVADVENFILQGIDLLIISPNEAAPLTDVVTKAFDQGIPVVVLDRKVLGDQYTMWIGADNTFIGETAGERVAAWCADQGHRPCNVAELRGLEGSTPAQERGDGFRAGIAGNPDVEIVASQNADWLREKAIPTSQAIFQANPDVHVVYAHNDPMAEAAYISAENAGLPLDDMFFVGIDALPTPDGGIRSVLEGRIDATYVYPTGGAEAIDYALQLLLDGVTPEREVILGTQEVLEDNAVAVYESFGGDPSDADVVADDVAAAGGDDQEMFLIGMSQANKGEPWRQAMNDQIEAAAAEHPEIEVVFADAAQDNAKQVADVENFILQGIDLLIISPNEAAPLTDVVTKAFDQGIPVVVLDRKVLGDQYTMWIGADNTFIGETAGERVAAWCADQGHRPCNVAELRGLEGSTPAQERGDGFRAGIAGNPDVEIVASQNADWLREKAIPTSQAIFQANPDVHVVYAHNDPMAEAAYISAENAGLPLDDMFFVGIDALPTPDGGIRSVLEGRIDATYVYPTGGAEAIDYALQLLLDGVTPEREVILGTQEVLEDNAVAVYESFGG